MENVVARMRIKGKGFEILVDIDPALKLKKSVEGVSIQSVLQTNAIFYDLKQGLHASAADLQKFFGTDDIYEVAERIVKHGEILLPLEHKKKEREQRLKQIVDFLSKNAIDPRSDRPYTPEIITRTINEAGINIDNKPVNEQISKVMEKLKNVLPIKIETKKIILTVPAIHTGKVYGLIKDYKESEDWLSDGSLKCVLNIPAGIQFEFYDKLNAVTHGSAVTVEMKQ